MNNVTKKAISILTSFTLVFLLSMSCFATGTETTTGLTGPTPLFIEVCNNLFTNPDEYKALDKGQQDITESFVNKYKPCYYSRSYDMLWNAFKNELYGVTWETRQNVARGSDSVSKEFYVLDETTDIMPGKTFEMLYSVSGSYTYDDDTHDILTISMAKLNVESFNAGSAFDYHLFDIEQDSNIGSNGKRAIFRVSFSLTLEFEYDLDGIPVWGEEDFGPYSGTVVGYPQ